MTLRLYYTDSYLRDFDAAVVDRADDGRRSLPRPHRLLSHLRRPALRHRDPRRRRRGGRRGRGRPDSPPPRRPARRDDRCTAAWTGPAASTTCSSTPASTSSRPCSHELFGHGTIGVHFGRESSTLDLDTPDLDHARLVEAEWRANEIVTENRPVEVSFEEAAAATGLRKASAREGTLRIVTIRGLDRSACGGTHVRATGEIGPILIRKVGAGEEERPARVRLRRAGGAPGPRRSRSPRRLAGQFSAAADELPGAGGGAARRAQGRGAAPARAGGELWPATAPRELYDGRCARWIGAATRSCVREEKGPIDRLRPLAQADRRDAPGVVRRVDGGAARARGRRRRPTRDWTRADCSGRRWKRSAGVAAAMPRLAQGNRPVPVRAGDERWPRSSRVPSGASPARTPAPPPTAGTERGARLAPQDRERLVPRAAAR